MGREIRRYAPIIKPLAQCAFEAFQTKRREQTPNIVFTEWDDLDMGLQECWSAVADAVIENQQTY
jgi:hypothetical protein